MPLIVISGLPASGKSQRAEELRIYFQSRGKIVHLISENVVVPKSGFSKNAYCCDSQKEKHIRSEMKSEVSRYLNKTDVIILDAANYIKGYRYELFCGSKVIRTTQCTLQTAIQPELAWEQNIQRTADDLLELSNNSMVPYTREVFDALCMRYEEPQSNNRWDSPLFVAFPNDKLEFDAIYSALYESKPLPPNQSTQNPPLSSTNYLYEMDRITQEIVDDVLEAQKINNFGPLRVRNSQVLVEIGQAMSAVQLNRMRRQFITYSKQNLTSSCSLDKIGQLFVQFINSNALNN